MLDADVCGSGVGGGRMEVEAGRETLSHVEETTKPWAGFGVDWEVVSLFLALRSGSLASTATIVFKISTSFCFCDSS